MFSFVCTCHRVPCTCLRVLALIETFHQTAVKVMVPFRQRRVCYCHYKRNFKAVAVLLGNTHIYYIPMHRYGEGSFCLPACLCGSLLAISQRHID